MIVLAVKGDPKKRLRSVIKVIDEHVAILDAKMLQLVHSFDEDKDSERLYMESLNAVREDIQFSMGQRRRLMKLYDIIEERGGNTEGINDMINDIMHYYDW